MIGSRSIGSLARWLVIGLVALPCAAQPVFDRLTRADGLPSDYILALFQDQYGFVWVGTDAGLARYDGDEVRTFTVSDGLPDPFVYCIAEDLDGVLWVGTFRGLTRRVGDRFVREEALGDERVSQLTVGGDGSLWVLRDAHLSVFRDGRWRHLDKPATGRWHSVVPLADGSVIANIRSITAGFSSVRLVVEANEIRVRESPQPEGLVLALGALGRVAWRQDGVLELVTLDGRRHSVSNRMDADETVARVLETERGEVVESGSRGASLWSPETRQWAPLMDVAVESHLLDREGSVWLGTFGQGAWRLRARHLTLLTDVATTRVEIVDGVVWASGDNLVRVDPQSRRAQVVSGEAGFRAIGGGADELLVSQRDEVRRVNGDGIGTPLFQDSDWVSDLVTTGDTLWVGTYGSGIQHRQQGAVVGTIGVADGLPTGMIEALQVTPGGVWALTRSAGAARIEGDRVRVLGVEQGMPGAAVHSVAQIGGSVWFGTGQGLGRWTEGRVQGIGAEALAGQRVLAMFERPSQPGVVWAVGDRALYRVEGTDVHAVDGFPILPDPTASINDAAYESLTDVLYLATTGGLVAVALTATPSASAAPLVALRAVTVDGRAVELHGTPRSARIDALDPGRYRVEVDVSALSFASDVRLEYLFDAGAWQPVGRRQQIAFADLGAGRHVVQVRARTAGGSVSAETARLFVEVLPFWWQRPVLVSVLIGMLLVLFGVGVRAFSLRRLRQRLGDAEREASAERRVRQERERISRDLHDHVGAQLASLLAGVELARLSQSDDPATDILQPIEADARATIGQLRETIWALHDESLTVGAFCDRLRAFASHRARGNRASVEVVCDVDTTAVLPPSVALGLYRVAQEGLSNALKHSGAARIEVRLTTHGGQVTLTVDDDGVFLEPSGGDGLFGFGLRSMEARATRLGGRFEMNTQDGTCVRVEVPAELTAPEA